MTSSRIILLLDQLRVCKGCLNRERSFDMPLNLTNNCNTKVVAMVRVIVDNPKQLLKKFADCWFTLHFCCKKSVNLLHCADVCPLRGTASIVDGVVVRLDALALDLECLNSVYTNEKKKLFSIEFVLGVVSW